MKRLLIFIIMLICGLNVALAADSPKDKLKQNLKSKDYLEAANYIKDALKDSPKDADLYVMCGDIYTEIGKLDSAVIMYNKANDYEKNTPNIIRKLASAYSSIGSFKEAIILLDKAIKDNKNDVYNYLSLGQVYINADSISQATLVITQAREMNKDLPDAYLALGDLYYKQQVYELARQNYEKAISKDENLINARANLASTYFKLGIQEQDTALSNQYFKNALDEWDKLAKKDPKYAKAYYEQGRILYFSKYYGFAIVKFKEYMRLRNMDFLGEWYLSDSYYQNLSFDSAVVYLSNFSKDVENMKKYSPSSVDSLSKKFRINVDSLNNLSELYLGRSYFQIQNYKECIQTLNKLRSQNVKLDIRDIELLASSYIKSADTVNAIKMYKEIINIDPSRCQLTYSIGQLLRSMKNFNEANYFFLKHLQNCGKDTLASKSLFYLGYDYFSMSVQDTSTKKQKLDSAIIFLLRSEALNNKDLFTKIYLADAYAAELMQDSAKAKFEEVISNGRKDTTSTSKLIVSQAFQKLAGIPMSEKNYKELQDIAKEWTEYDPQSPNGWLYLALSYQALGDKENACKFYKKVLQIDPNNTKVKDVVKKLCQ